MGKRRSFTGLNKDTPLEKINMRMAEMDYGEQNIIRYAISRLGAETPLDADSIWQMYRLFGTSSEYPRGIAEKMDRFLFV